MAKKPEGTELTSNVQESRLAVQAPGFMAADRNEGKTLLIGAVRPPYLKVVKGQSKSEFKKFGVGSVVLMPEGKVVFRAGESEGFYFVPVFYYPEFACINPFDLGDKLPTFRKRSTDAQSELARKCKNPETWRQPCPEDPSKMMQNREIMTFVVMILDDEMKPMEYGTMSFSGGEHKTGRRLASMITTKQAAPYGQIYKAATSVHTYQKGKYESEGLDVEVDQDYVFVQDETMYRELKALSELFEKSYNEGRLESTLDNEDVGPGEGSAESDAEAEARF